MTKIEFHPEAQLELENARRWYGERNQIAARAFVTEVFRALRNISAAPETWPDPRK